MSSSSHAPLKVISPDRATQAAEQAIKDTGMLEWSQCGILKNPDIGPQPPMLVREPPDQDGAEETHSYIVPFGLKGEQTPEGVPIARICILVDANDGEFEEVAAFGKPLAYLRQEHAIRIVASALHIPEGQLHVTDASLMFQSSAITHLREYPFWAITVSERVYYVDQEGNLYTRIPPSLPGS